MNELYANGWLSAAHTVDLPEEGTPDWELLVDMELEASRESPGAGPHIIAWATVP